nr:hypothetical protein [Tanacetum cinerariifolium]
MHYHLYLKPRNHVVQVRKNGILVVAIGLQVVAPNDIFTPTSVVRMRGGSEALSSEARSSSNRLGTINGKIVRRRRKEDGSRAYMYPNRRINVTFLQNAMGYMHQLGKDNKCSRTSATGTFSSRTIAAAEPGLNEDYAISIEQMLANVETWDSIVKMTFGVKKPTTGSGADHDRGKENLEVSWAVNNDCLRWILWTTSLNLEDLPPDLENMNS